MKRVAITQRVDIVTDRGERRDALDQRWIAFLAECGLIGVPVPNRADVLGDFCRAMDFQGVVLTGGNDLAVYGGDAPERDQTEFALVELARRDNLPIMAVCRGMQVIQHLFGVPLHRVGGHVTPRHLVEIEGTPVETNSYHQYAATTTVPALVVWARASDGVVEAIRHVAAPIVGVMWHPERVEPFPNRDKRMFRHFFGISA